MTAILAALSVFAVAAVAVIASRVVAPWLGAWKR